MHRATRVKELKRNIVDYKSALNQVSQYWPQVTIYFQWLMTFLLPKGKGTEVKIVISLRNAEN